MNRKQRRAALQPSPNLTSAPVPAPAASLPSARRPRIDPTAAIQDAKAAYDRGELNTAEAILHRALAQHPHNAEALHLLGVVLYRTGRIASGAQAMEAAVALSPQTASYRSNFGLLLHAQGRLEDAAVQHREALRLNPDHAEAHNNLGNVLQLQGRFDEATAHYTRALHLKPNYADALTNLGAVAKAQGRTDDAIAHYRRALTLRPSHAATHYNLGNALSGTGHLPEAADAFQQALTCDPASAPAHYNLGNALAEQGNLDGAIATFREAIRLDPVYADAHANLGIALQESARFDEAHACYQAALALRPDDPRVRMNQGMLHLLLGDLAAGWPGYECRKQAVPDSASRTYPRPLWRGEPLAGRRILLHPEQGLGDTLQFLRYVPLVQAAGAHVLLLVQPSLRRLAAELPGPIEVVYDEEALPLFDFHCPLPSLPLAFGTTLKTVPATVPYLHVPEEERTAAAALPWPATGLRVGLVWGGNPNQSRDRFRSMPLAACGPILRVEGVHIYSLQVGPPADQLQTAGAPIATLDLVPGNMADTAAKILQLDLVLTVCTSVAHLAGALGVPTWVMLSHAADWRWFLDREDSPWYPTARLFRQPRPGDWATVTQQVAQALTVLRDASHPDTLHGRR